MCKNRGGDNAIGFMDEICKTRMTDRRLVKGRECVEENIFFFFHIST